MKPRPKKDKRTGQRKIPRIHMSKDHGPRAAALTELKAIKVIHHKNPRRVT